MLRSTRYVLMVCLVTAWAARAGGQIIPPEAALTVVDWKDAHKYVAQEVILQGRIVATKNIGRICFLNFDKARTCTAIIRESNYKNFPEPPEKLYKRKIVRIRGVIREYKGRPEIEIVRPEQVTILEKAEPIPSRPEPKQRPFTGIVTVGTLNAYNLFDEYDDPYHADEGTPAKPKEALEKLAATIRAVDADVLALQEIENRGYLERFVGACLRDMGYEYVVCIESNDRRGIECAVLSRLPVGPVTSYRHLRFPDGSGKEMHFRRDMLQVQIRPPESPAFSVFVLHLKSKRGGGQETEKYRLGEARQVRKIVDRLLERDKDSLFLICGDFQENWDSKTVKTLRGEGAMALSGFVADIPKGTVTFNKKPHLDMIDFILASPAMARRYVAKSYQVIQGSVASSGSDHNPVLAKFDMQ